MDSLKPQVIVVEASAGSGKTYALAKRYVQLSLQLAMLKPMAIQNILAITFTNKAAFAMKSRILDFLKRMALKQLDIFEIEDMLTPLGLDEEKASVLAFRLMDQVIHQYHYFQVQTIDSFMNILLVGCSFKIGLSARFTIERNAGEYLQLSLDELLDQASTDESLHQLFEGFVKQYLFLENRSGWFPREDLVKVLSELFRQYNTFQKPLLVYPHQENVYEFKKKIYGLMRVLLERCPVGTHKRFLDHLQHVINNKEANFDLDDLKVYWTYDALPVNKGVEIDRQLFSLWEELKDQIQRVCNLEARSIFNPYIRLFNTLIVCFNQLARRDDLLFLAELNRKTALLFEEDLVSVEELYFRLATRIEHYLMDEFQDTSLGQWRNLSTLVMEALGQGGSLFYVGDKKQAIYAFRGGESRLFDALQVELQSFNVERLSLRHNYRSFPEIIAFNNKVFSLDNLKAFLERRCDDARENKRDEINFSASDVEVIVNNFQEAEQLQGKNLKGGVVRVIPLEGRVKNDRAIVIKEKLILLINDLKNQYELKEIAVLTRGNQQLEEITQWFLEAGILASSERSSDIKNNPLIMELIFLLKFLSNPDDNNAFTQFCLGALMPCATGLSSQEIQNFLFAQALKDRLEGTKIFYKAFKENFNTVWEDFFADLSKQVGVLPLYELVVSILDRFRCESYFPQYQGFLMHLLEIIKRLEKESCDLGIFLEYFENFEGEERFVPMAQLNAVKVLTVHKAKGLEFPVVILPFLEMDIKAGSGGRDGSQAYMLDIQEEGMALIRLKETYRQFVPELQIAYEEEYKKSFISELNNIYVALTRAIEALYIFVPDKVGNRVNPAKFLIPQELYVRGELSERLHTQSQADKSQRIKPFAANPWQGLREDFLNKQAISPIMARKGEFYHALLMHIKHVDGSNLDALLDGAWEKVSKVNILAFARDEMITALRHFIKRQDIQPFFYMPREANILCEKEFVNQYGDVKRIDRLIIHKDNVYVIDYKLAENPSLGHQEQMDKYILLIKSFYPGFKVSGHILYLNLS